MATNETCETVQNYLSPLTQLEHAFLDVLLFDLNSKNQEFIPRNVRSSRETYETFYTSVASKGSVFSFRETQTSKDHVKFVNCVDLGSLALTLDHAEFTRSQRISVLNGVFNKLKAGKHTLDSIFMIRGGKIAGVKIYIDGIYFESAWISNNRYKFDTLWRETSPYKDYEKRKADLIEDYAKSFKTLRSQGVVRRRDKWLQALDPDTMRWVSKCFEIKWYLENNNRRCSWKHLEEARSIIKDLEDYWTNNAATWQLLKLANQIK